MKLKNEALQKLYDTIVNCTITISPFADSPVDEAFKECDERLSGSATFAYIKELQKRTDIFKKDLDEAKSSLEYFKTSRNDWRSRAKHEEEEKVEQVKRADNLKTQIDKILGENVQLKQDHESDVRVIGKLHSQMVDLEDEKTEQKKRADNLKCQVDKVLGENFQLKQEVELLDKDRDDFQCRAHRAEDEVEQLKKDKEQLEHSRIEWFKKATERGRELHDAEEKIRDLKVDRDIWVRNNGEKQAEIAELKRKLEATTQIDELKKRMNSLYGVDSDGYIQRLKDSVNDIGYEQGQTDLWDMLQNVNDTQPNEFDVECEGMEDVIGMDLEDFLDCYKKWQDQKETDRMRDYLERFCIGKVCNGCPLHTPELKCGRGSWFCDMSAEDIKRHYEKAVGHGRYTMKDDPCSGVREAIKDACDAFCDGLKAGLASEVKEVPVSFDIPIKDLGSWECTLESNVEVNKDLLEKVCGVKPEEEEHKLEYGDAVRVPWRDYDYMYIGPEEKHIRLFNPKTHTVVFVSPTEKLTYQGSKIVICDEDDLRKIWKVKK